MVIWHWKLSALLFLFVWGYANVFSSTFANFEVNTKADAIAEREDAEEQQKRSAANAAAWQAIERSLKVGFEKLGLERPSVDEVIGRVVLGHPPLRAAAFSEKKSTLTADSCSVTPESHDTCSDS